jgi:glycine cleavage system H protein
MQLDPANTVYYRRARFSCRLPKDRLFSPAHYWLLETSPGVWRVGLTKFALRMLGELVELDWTSRSDEPVELGQAIGTIEGFKAISDIYCAAHGELCGVNSALDADLTLADAHPYTDGWLYEVRGRPGADAVDVQGYIDFLDLTIDKMKEKLDAQSKPC